MTVVTLRQPPTYERPPTAGKKIFVPCLQQGYIRKRGITLCCAVLCRAVPQIGGGARLPPPLGWLAGVPRAPSSVFHNGSKNIPVLSLVTRVWNEGGQMQAPMLYLPLPFPCFWVGPAELEVVCPPPRWDLLNFNGQRVVTLCATSSSRNGWKQMSFACLNFLSSVNVLGGHTSEGKVSSTQASRRDGEEPPAGSFLPTWKDPEI